MEASFATRVATAVESNPRVERWPSESRLWWVILLVSLSAWVTMILSVVGILYAVFLGILFFVGQLAFIAHLRGNAVRLGPEQMPELHERVREIAGRLGMARAPDAYVLQEGGALNALATRFLRSDFIVLFSDLLEACGDNTDARDFIVAHELGHLKAGHLRLRWLLLPGLFAPFLGQAYSRACEYTSDRYGLAAARDPWLALDGLTILAAGAKHGPTINRRALVAQRRDLNGVWMKIGQWLSTHPSIAHRLAVLDPSLSDGPIGGRLSALGAAALVFAVFTLVPFGAGIGVGMLSAKVKAIQQAQRAAHAGAAARAHPAAAPAPAEDDAEESSDEKLSARLQTGILSLASVAEAQQQASGAAPKDVDELYAIWAGLNPGASEPTDPFSGDRFGYARRADGRFLIWSVGQNADDDADDLSYESVAVGTPDVAAAKPKS